MQITKQKKQVVMLYGTSVVGLLVGVLVSVLNTRSLPPALYGDVRYVQNLISFISSLLLLGFFTSGSRLLALSKDEQNSRRIRGIMCVILGITILILMASMSVLYLISLAKGQTNMSPLYLAAIPVCGNIVLLNYVNTTAQGDNHIGRLSIARLLPSTLYLAIAYVVYKYSGATPVKMLLLYNGLAVIVLASVILSAKPSFKGLAASFRDLNEENKKYGFNVYLGGLVAVSTQYLAGIFLGKFCTDNANVGFYTLALTLAGPLAMLPGIIGTTYFKRFASQNRIDKKIFLSSILLTLLSLLIFVVCIKYVVMFLYDDSYAVVSTFASYLAIGTCFHGFGDMLNRFLGAHGKGTYLRNGAIACGICAVLGNVILVYFWKINGAIVTRIISSMVYLLFMVGYYLKFTKDAQKEI